MSWKWIKIKWTIEYQQSLLIDEYFTDEKWAIISYEYLVLSLIFVFYILSTQEQNRDHGEWVIIDWI